LDGVEAWDRAGTAHIRSRTDVSFRAAERHAEIGHAVLKRRGLAAVFMVRFEHGPRVDVTVLQREQLAFPGGADPDALLRARPVTDRVEHHLAAQHESDWPANLPSGGCGQRTMRPGE